MSISKFTEFYKAKKNLDLLSDELPYVKKTLDSLHTVNNEIHENYQSEIDSVNAQKTILATGLDDCYNTLVEVDLENMYLTYEVERLKKRQIKIFGIGIGAGIASYLILTKVFLP